MKKEREIWLKPEEIQQLLEGGLYWKDIEAKLSPEGRSITIEKDERTAGIKENEGLIGEEETEAVHGERRLEVAAQEPESEQVRAILLGEMEKEPVIKDRQIQIEQLREEVEETCSSIAATGSEDIITDKVSAKESSVEENAVSANNEFKELIFNKPEEEERPVFGGFKLVLLLIAVAALTFGFWYYYVSM